MNRIGGAAALAGGADQRRGLNTVLVGPPTGKDYERSFLEACESIAAGDPWRAARRNKAHGNQCALVQSERLLKNIKVWRFTCLRVAGCYR